MFKDYTHTRTDLYNEPLYSWRIIDDDFIEDVVDGVFIAQAVILCYTKKNLPIAPNLFRCMLAIKEKQPSWTINAQVEWYKQYMEAWEEVEDDMQMYLTFS